MDLLPILRRCRWWWWWWWWGVSKSCKYKFTCKFTENKICKFEISVNMHHEIPVNCKISNIINIPNFITTQNPITKLKLLNLYGAFCFLCCWEIWCQWFGFPLTECLWVFDNDDDCEDQWSWSCRHGWWLCADLIPGDKLLIGIFSGGWKCGGFSPFSDVMMQFEILWARGLAPITCHFSHFVSKVPLY